MTNVIQTNSLEIFKQNVYKQYSIGYVSNNAYPSIVVTNKCQCACSYCINSETNHSFQLPIDKAIQNIKKLVSEYGIKEAILLGGEPTLHSNIIELVKKLRTETGLECIRLTSNAIRLTKDYEFLKQLIDPNFGVQGLNISYHGDDNFISVKYTDLQKLYSNIKSINPAIKVRLNTNIWKGNRDNIESLLEFLNNVLDTTIDSVCDEVRVSNIIPKDDFSVNSSNNSENLCLSDVEYNNLFSSLIEHYSEKHIIFENTKTLGFVRYLLIPSCIPIIVNWNIGSTVSQQVCENDIKNREINTFKCLVNGEISLSWNEQNII